MAFVYSDRVLETSTFTGPGDVDPLSGAPDGSYQTFDDVMADGDTTDIAIFDGSDFETCPATYVAASNTLQRGTPYASSNGGAAVSFGAGTKTVILIAPAAKFAMLNKLTTVRAATTGNITIATALNNGDTLDGVTLATGDLVLVKDQSSAAENGLYVVGASPVRWAALGLYDLYCGMLVTVQEGTANAGRVWLCTSSAGGTLGSTALAFSRFPAVETKEFMFALSDEVNNLSTGTAKATWRAPHALENVTLRASVNTAPTGSTIIVDVNKNGSTMMSVNKLSIDASEKTSTTAATAVGMTTTTLADDDEVTFDIDQVGSTIPGKGLKVYLYGNKP